jgi:hypothetical protein
MLTCNLKRVQMCYDMMSDPKDLVTDEAHIS